MDTIVDMPKAAVTDNGDAIEFSLTTDDGRKLQFKAGHMLAGFLSLGLTFLSIKAEQERGNRPVDLEKIQAWSGNFRDFGIVPVNRGLGFHLIRFQVQTGFGAINVHAGASAEQLVFLRNHIDEYLTKTEGKPEAAPVH